MKARRRLQAPEGAGAMITIVTTCKDREEHLARSLPLMQKTEWPVVLVHGKGRDLRVEQSGGGRVHGVYVNGPWQKTQWLNVGLRTVETPYVMFCDADVLLEPEQVKASVTRWAEPDRFLCVGYDPGGKNVGLTGWLVADVQAMLARGGFDERMVGWGAEDLDMRLRLALDAPDDCDWRVDLRKLSKQEPCFLFAEEVGTPIEHGDDLRVMNQDCKDRNKSMEANMRILEENYERLTATTFREGMRRDPLVRALCTVKFD